MEKVKISDDVIYIGEEDKDLNDEAKNESKNVKQKYLKENLSELERDKIIIINENKKKRKRKYFKK